MNHEVLELSKQLIQLKTDPGNHKELQQALKLCLKELNGFTVEHFERNGEKSILVYNTPKRPKKFKLILNGHLDIIPAKDFQHTPVVKGPRLYGAGSMDMKSNVACLIAAFKQTANTVSYPLGLQIVTDEEVGGFDGTGYQVEEGIRSEFVISGETTQFNIVTKAKGIMWVRLTTKGETAHGAYPWKGKNAIWLMTDILANLKKEFPIPHQQEWITTLNLSSIEAPNKAFNKVPDECSVQLDIRYIPEDKDTLISRIEKHLTSECTMEILTNEAALFVEDDNPFVQLLKRTTEKITSSPVRLYGAQGSSDARHFTKVGNNGVEFGPIGGGIGSDEEWVDLPSLTTYINILIKYIQKIDTSS